MRHTQRHTETGKLKATHTLRDTLFQEETHNPESKTHTHTEGEKCKHRERDTHSHSERDTHT